MKATVHGTTHEETLPRLRRIAGQVQGIQRMVEEGAISAERAAELLAALRGS